MPTHTAGELSASYWAVAARAVVAPASATIVPDNRPAHAMTALRRMEFSLSRTGRFVYQRCGWGKRFLGKVGR
ncbi:hypothetical protein GCM10027075_28750 [Streptomyces heilongjiangensis]